MILYVVKCVIVCVEKCGNVYYFVGQKGNVLEKEQCVSYQELEPKEYVEVKEHATEKQKVKENEIENFETETIYARNSGDGGVRDNNNVT